MQVDRTGSNDTSRSVQLLLGGTMNPPADHGDLAILDRYVTMKGGRTSGPIDNGTVSNYFIECWHTYSFFPLSLGAAPNCNSGW